MDKERMRSAQGLHFLHVQQQTLWLATTSASTFENKIFHNQPLDKQVTNFSSFKLTQNKPITLQYLNQTPPWIIHPQSFHTYNHFVKATPCQQ
jgi:hypothetical protein